MIIISQKMIIIIVTAVETSNLTKVRIIPPNMVRDLSEERGSNMKDRSSCEKGRPTERKRRESENKGTTTIRRASSKGRNLRKWNILSCIILFSKLYAV
jgi:hypothetical protein